MKILKYVVLLALLFCFLPSHGFGKIDQRLLQQAQQGDAQAQYELGLLYSKQVDDEKALATAIKWYMKAI